MYNKDGECFHHKVEDLRVELRTISPTVPPETSEATKITLPPPRKARGKKRWSQSDKIIGLICDTLDVPFSDIEGRRTKSEIVHARHLIMYLLSEDTNLSSTRIGWSLGGRDHSTVLSGRNNIADKLLVDDDLSSLIKDLRSKYSCLKIKKDEKKNKSQPKKIVEKEGDSKSDKIIKLACAELDVQFSDIKGKSRKAEIVRPRQIIMYLLSEDTNLSSTRIGRKLGMRDHSTVLGGKNNIAEKLLVDADLRHTIENLRSNYQ